MKQTLLILTSLYFCIALSAQVVVYYEDFEPPSLDDLVTSSTITGGPANWAITSSFASSGTYADSCQVHNATITCLATDFFSTLGMSGPVLLEFNHICKVSYFDIAEIEVSGDSGQTWNKLTDQYYLGANSAFGGLGSRFAESSYGHLWAPAVPVPPSPTWWRNELFDISAFATNANYVAVRFKLSDGGTPGPQGRYGWLIDDVKVSVDYVPFDAGVIEIIEPQDSTTNGTNFDVTVKIRNFGMDTLDSIPLGYSINGLAVGSDVWTGTLPPQASAIFTFQSQPSPYQAYQLCAYTDLPLDMDMTNDMVCDTLAVIVDISDPGITEVEKFSLGQSIPNPAAGEVLIPFNIPVGREYNFSLFNSQGQEVLSIRDKGQSGQQHIDLDTQRFPSGLYFYFIEYENQRLVRKMVVE